MTADLRQHLDSVLPHLEGDWVASNSGYEIGLCAASEFTYDPNRRYWDATWGQHCIELKKGTSIWLDLVRYSEVRLKLDSNAAQATLTMFFVPKPGKRAIREIICVQSSRLVELLVPSDAIARTVLDLNSSVPRSLNAQASLTLADVRKLQTFAVS